MLSANSLSWSAAHCAKMLSSYEERDENHREPSLGGWWWLIKHFSSKTLQGAAEHCHKEGQYLRITFLVAFLNKGIELQHALHIWQETLLFRHVYGLTTRSELTTAMCRDRREFCRHCATHLRKVSSDSHCGSNFVTDRTLKKIALVLFTNGFIFWYFIITFSIMFLFNIRF